MPISAITAVRAPNATDPTYGADAPKTTTKQPGTLDREAFLKLLVAQLKYQDPSKPMDASQMVSQSAQLSMVDKLDSISTLLTSSAITDKLTLAGSMVGKQISFADTDGTAVTATVRSVRFSDTGTLILSAGDWDVPMELVTAVSAATTAIEAPAASAPAASAPAASPPAASPPAASAPATSAPAAAAPPSATPPAGATPPATDPAVSDPTTPIADPPAAVAPATLDPVEPDPSPPATVPAVTDPVIDPALTV